MTDTLPPHGLVSLEILEALGCLAGADRAVHEHAQAHGRTVVTAEKSYMQF